MSTIGGTSNVRTAATQSATLTPAQAKSTWQNELNNELAERGKFEHGSFGFLPSHRIDAYKGKVEADMAKYVQEHPNASAEDIKQAAQDSIKKHSTHEILGKMEFEYFLTKMTSRMQELSSDMWK